MALPPSVVLPELPEPNFDMGASGLQLVVGAGGPPSSAAAPWVQGWAHQGRGGRQRWGRKFARPEASAGGAAHTRPAVHAALLGHLLPQVAGWGYTQPLTEADTSQPSDVQ